MKEYKLNNYHLPALLDDEDFIKIKNLDYTFSARVHRSGKIGAVSTTIRGKTIAMARIIMDLTDIKLEVDHTDRNPLNNQRYNLRIVSKSQNLRNRILPKYAAKHSKYRNVCWHKQANKWQSGIMINRKHISGGLHISETDAALASNALMLRYNYPTDLLNIV